MSFELTMLGTSCMVPTKDRNVQSIFVDFKGEGILFDCGEGTQRQMNLAGINRNRVRKIFISHWHGDHVGGLIGLLQTISNSENPQSVTIFGPRDTKDRIHHLMKAISYEAKRFMPEIVEVNPKGLEKIYDGEEYYVEAAYLEHSIPCLGFSIVEKDKLRINMTKAKKLGLGEGPVLGKLQRGQTVHVQGKTITPEDVATLQEGKKITMIMDTQICENAVLLAKDADLLISESAYSADMEEKAAEYKHMTTKHAALIATKSGAKKLLITHFSQRYGSVKELAEEVKTFFSNSECAYDFMKLKI
jgi:ribonuclease Z